MTRLSSLILLSAAAVALASPALAKISVQSGENLCKTEIGKQTPAPTSVKVDKEATKATSDAYVFTFKVTHDGSDVAAKVRCTVDRGTEAVSGVAPIEG